VTVNIIPEKKYPFKIISAKANKGQNIRFELDETIHSDKPGYVLTVENTITTKGRFSDSIKIVTDSTIRPEFKVWVFGNITEVKK